MAERKRPIIRLLTAGEILAILPLAKSYIEASGLPVRFQPEKVARYWELLYRTDNGVLFGLWDSHELVGALGVNRIESTFGDGYAANEWLWWVDPAHRGGSGALRLLREAERWAADRGLPLLVGAYDHLSGASLASLYARRGYRRLGCQFLRSPQGGAHV